MSVLLVPVDLSESSALVCEHAASLAVRLRKMAVLLCVLENEEAYNKLMAPDRSTSPEATSTAAALDQLRDCFTRRCVAVDTAFRTGPVVLTILAEAEQRRAELIVVGSHGRGALHSLLVGSTTAGLIRQSAKPLVVVPHGAATPA